MITRHRLTMLLLIAAAALAGCAGPRYQTLYRYEPPQSGAGLACLEKCAKAMSECQQNCKAGQQACLNQIGPEVENRFAEALASHENELARYHWELERYLQLSHWSRMPWLGPRIRHPWPGYAYFPPFPPGTPSRDSIFNQLQAERCPGGCGCQPVYDSCFLACGGKRIPEVKCLMNCPEGNY